MTASPLSYDYDAIVVGARCAGASTAMLLARGGLRVLLVDRGQDGQDALSTHALMRGGVLQLHRWGVLPELAAITPAIRAVAFHYADEVVAIPIKPRDGVDCLYAPRRTVLDRSLVQAARAAGAKVMFNVSAVALARDEGGRVAGAVLAQADGTLTRVDARIVIGADGMRSRVASLAGATVARAGGHASATVYGYWSGLDVDGYHWHYREGVSAGAIPTNDGRTCLFVAMPSRRFAEELSRGLGALYYRVLSEAAPEHADAVCRARLDGKLRPFAGVPGLMRRAWGPGWALVGDAGCFRDPITAHGITDALRDAELLARAVMRGTDAALAEYEATRDEAALGLFEISDAIASFAWDLDRVKELHLALTRQMAIEVELLRALDRAPLADHDHRPAASPHARGQAPQAVLEVLP